MERARALAVVYWSSDIRTSSRGAADAPAVESDTANAMAPMRAEPLAGLGRGAAGLIEAAVSVLEDLVGADRDDLAPPVLGARVVDIRARHAGRGPLAVPGRERQVLSGGPLGRVSAPLGPFLRGGAGPGEESNPGEHSGGRDP